MTQRSQAAVRNHRAGEDRPSDRYRVGYHHAAKAVVGAVNHLLPPHFARQLGNWLDDLANWAAHNKHGENPPRVPWTTEP